MGEEGYEYADSVSARESFDAQARDVLGGIVEPGFAPRVQLAEVELAEELGPSRYEELEALRSREVQVAVADVECSDGMAALWYEVNQEHLNDIANGS